MPTPCALSAAQRSTAGRGTVSMHVTQHDALDALGLAGLPPGHEVWGGHVARCVWLPLEGWADVAHIIMPAHHGDSVQ